MIMWISNEVKVVLGTKEEELIYPLGGKTSEGT